MSYIPQHISELLGNPTIKYYMVTKDYIAWKMFFVTQGVSLCKNLSNKWVLKWFVGLIDVEQHTARDKKPYEHWKSYQPPKYFIP